ncbi:ThiF family adenylyltransferase [Chryseobacterium sp. R2ACT005]|uniref:ThiF family adenylyltransferase n=1 Tax=Chryseobacterium sp. R2ACT005 TaxID=3416668 RepID=UPI003CF4191E
MNFSATLQKFEDDIKNPFLKDSLYSLEKISGNKLDILDWGNKRIAIPLNISVNLPNLGTFNGIDIRENEPILLVIDEANYPEKCPVIYTDRLDFPKDELAHLYIATNGRPPAICYVRENPNEWYANKRIEDVIIRINNWFRDAAIGELTEDGEQYEPMRLEGYYSTIIYDYDLIMKEIIENNPFPVTTEFSVAQFEQVLQNDRRTYKLIKKTTPENIQPIIQEIRENQDKQKNDTTKRELSLAFFLWNNENTINSNYAINLPTNWEDFKTFCHNYGIKCDVLMELIIDAPFREFPVIVGIRRPKPIIGYSADIELLNFEFVISKEDICDGKIINNFHINILSHNQPLSIAQSEKISGTKIELSRAVVFGCGALGSKVVMHFARSGITNLSLLDPDSISSHNLVRHSLFADSIGKNKAAALKEKIKEIYPNESLQTLSSTSFKEGLIDQEETFKPYEWLFDFTASEAFFNKLSVIKSVGVCQVASASISDFGNLGILYKEGQNRNPRIDDMQAFLYSSALTNPKISEWLIGENTTQSNSNLIVRVGIGCNSETTVLSDEKVSSHSSYFAGALKKEIANKSDEGKIFLNIISDSEDYMVETQNIIVEPFKVFKAVNNNWTLRFKNGILENIKMQSTKAKDNEIGGVFIGICNYKTKTFFITDLLKAPKDSKGDHLNFFRGFKDLAQEIAHINKKTGGQIGYIGEWHSHPHGPDNLSPIDMQCVKEYKEELNGLKTPLPVLLSIITPSGFYPYIF